MLTTDGISDLAPPLFKAVAQFAADHWGIHFGETRRNDLMRALACAARDTGFESGAAFANWLLAPPATQEKRGALIPYVTVGETYFFREPAMFAALTRQILPEIIRHRRSIGRPCLKIWSAGCATGEEAYSLAITLMRTLTDLNNWDLFLSATDINTHFLQTAMRGLYHSWSFRGIDPDILRQFFSPAGKAYEVIPAVQRRVRFSQGNLASDVPSSGENLHDLDLIVCRNVLMYFTPTAARMAIARFADSLRFGGWLVVGAAEYSQSLFKDFEVVKIGEAFFYRKPEFGAKVPPYRPPRRIRNVGKPHRNVARETSPGNVSHAAQLARAAADRGILSEATMWAGRAIAADKTDAGLHYLQGQIFLEAGNHEAAAAALDRAIYLNPHFALAHYLRATVALAIGGDAQASRHYANALTALSDKSADDPVDGANGLTVAHLMSMINAAATRVQR